MKILDFMALAPIRDAFARMKSIYDTENGIVRREEVEEGTPFIGGVGQQIRLRFHEMSWRDEETWRYEVLNKHGRVMIQGMFKGAYAEAALQAGQHAWSYYI